MTSLINTNNTTQFKLTDDQQAASNMFVKFITDPKESAFVIEGYSGTGKSTLVKHLLNELPLILRAIRGINPSFVDYEVHLTATTNKAAQALYGLSKQETRTIHSLLAIRPIKDLKTGKTTLISALKEPIENAIIFIDEASYVDSELLNLIFGSVRRCKIVFMGDPAQLTPVMSSVCPVFLAGFTTAKLTKVVRNTGAILELSTLFRETVSSGVFPQFKPDGESIIHLPRRDFNNALLATVQLPEWHSNHSKFLAWRNETVIKYNQGLVQYISGCPNFKPGDYAVNNAFCMAGKKGFKADEDVYISNITPAVQYGLQGYSVELNNDTTTFMPSSLAEKKALIKQLQQNNDIQRLGVINREWIDLRSAFACTINKAQGSTYKQVFIDLDDISKCSQGNQIARMLYVGTSRATDKVYFTGDFV